mmetsp:Transcript_62602/g.136878  ORF Transcript_62602/g.136878 Transcript_62602/m.136878 type:complete len:381 (-) Transcript_62602:86-1228(-)
MFKSDTKERAALAAAAAEAEAAEAAGTSETADDAEEKKSPDSKLSKDAKSESEKSEKPEDEEDDGEEGEGEEGEEEEDGVEDDVKSSATSKSKSSRQTKSTKSSKVTKSTKSSKVSAKPTSRLIQLDNESTLKEVFAQLLNGSAGGKISPYDITRLLKDVGGSKVEGKLVQEVMEQLKPGFESQGLTQDEFVKLVQGQWEGAQPLEESEEIWLLLGGSKAQTGMEEKISTEQLSRVLQRLGAPGELVPEEEVEGLIGLAGGSDGLLDFEQFERLLTPVGGLEAHGLTKEELTTFLRGQWQNSQPRTDLELNGKAAASSGKISAEQFYRAMRRLGADVHLEEAEDLLGLAGGMDGVLDYEQFVHLLTPPAWGLPPILREPA